MEVFERNINPNYSLNEFQDEEERTAEQTRIIKRNFRMVTPPDKILKRKFFVKDRMILSYIKIRKDTMGRKRKMDDYYAKPQYSSMESLSFSFGCPSSNFFNLL